VVGFSKYLALGEGKVTPKKKRYQSTIPTFYI
jgi:hypothetical protein